MEGVGSFKTMGSIGPNRVNVFETDMGPFGYRGSAATAMRAMRVTGATGIIQLGMAFGAYPTLQNIADVLVSSSIVTYDFRTVREVAGGDPPYEADYADPSNPTPRFEASESLLNLFANAADDPGGDFCVHVGTFLSGGARIQSANYRDHLLRSVPSGDRPFVGGEMEGVGLPPANVDPAWIMVKGISDFADGADPDSFPDRCKGVQQFRRICASHADEPNREATIGIMPSFDDIFEAGRDASSHPKLRFWKQQKAQATVSDVRCELRRPRDLLGYKPAKLYVHF